jgi:hypothetical protein
MTLISNFFNVIITYPTSNPHSAVSAGKMNDFS